MNRQLHCIYRRIVCMIFVSALLFSTIGTSAKTRFVQLELLLAVDSSFSVNDHEFNLQVEGIAQAFEDPSVIYAIESSGREGIAVSLVQWSGVNDQTVALGWTQLRGNDDALAFAKSIREVGRVVDGGSTAIGSVVHKAVESIMFNGIEGRRQIIDVSGDGSANEGASPAHARAYANRNGITVNGLAILNEEPNLADYYRKWIVGGSGSFLMTADDYVDFIQAIRQKLLREISIPVTDVPVRRMRFGALSDVPR